jgi:hypothetical protein
MRGAFAAGRGWLFVDVQLGPHLGPGNHAWEVVWTRRLRRINESVERLRSNRILWYHLNFLRYGGAGR